MADLPPTPVNGGHAGLSRLAKEMRQRGYEVLEAEGVVLVLGRVIQPETRAQEWERTVGTPYYQGPYRRPDRG